MCSFPLVGFLTERFGCRAVSAGGAFLALLAVFPFLWMIQNQFSPALTVMSLLVAGAGQGTISIPSVSAGVCCGSERQACCREHGDQYRPKIGRTARDNGRGFCYLAFGK